MGIRGQKRFEKRELAFCMSLMMLLPVNTVVVPAGWNYNGINI